MTEIIKQQIDDGTITFDYPEQLAEMILIILTVKLDNSLVPSTPDDVSMLFQALISLLENGAHSPANAFDFLTQK